MAYGGVMPLYAVIAREYFPMRIMGTVIGASSLIASLGMSLGPAVGGWIFDTFGTYGWLYLGSLVMGLAAAGDRARLPAGPVAPQRCGGAAGVIGGVPLVAARGARAVARLGRRRTVRRALGDDSRHPRLLETRHRRGYRLLVPVTPAAMKGLATKSSTPLSLADRPSLAVLPFDSLSPERTRNISRTA